MFYKITRITDLKGKDKVNDKTLGRIDRVMDINPANIYLDRSLCMICAKPGISKSLVTSRVKNLKATKNELVITTENSIYYLTRGR